MFNNVHCIWESAIEMFIKMIVISFDNCLLSLAEAEIYYCLVDHRFSSVFQRIPVRVFYCMHLKTLEHLFLEMFLMDYVLICITKPRSVAKTLNYSRKICLKVRFKINNQNNL